MGYTRFTENTTQGDAQDSLVGLEACLSVYPDAGVHSLAPTVQKLIDEGDEAEMAVKKARRALIKANALVRTWDGVSDDRVREFNKDLLAAVRLDRSHPLFKAMLAGQTASEIVEMSLEPEVGELDRMVEELGKSSTPTSLRKAWLGSLQDAATHGRGALSTRKAANVALAEAYDATTRWVEKADRVRRSVDGRLTTYASDHGLTHDFNDRFFPSAATEKRISKKVE